jgi:hypothetical protein
MQLVEWQQQFLQYVQTPSTPTGKDLNSVFADSAVYSADRMLAYRNNYAGALLSFLKLAYPQVRALLGEQYFEFLGQEYIANNPLSNNNYEYYGATFPSYLTQGITEKKALENLPYLADVAAVDWGMYLAYYAAPRCSFDFTAYAQLASEQQQMARPFLANDVVLVQSQWPLMALWMFYRDDCPLTQIVQESDSGFYVIHRPKHAATLVQVTCLQWQVLEAVAGGNTIQHLANINPEVIPDLISEGWICGWKA